MLNTFQLMAFWKQSRESHDF